MLITAVTPGEQILLLPDWATRTIAKNGSLEDITNFGKTRQYFSNDQIMALDHFSSTGLNKIMGSELRGENPLYTRSAGYIWCFPTEANNSAEMNEADRYAWTKLTRSADDHSYGKYAERLCDELIIQELEATGPVMTDVTQFYSVYSVSKQLIILSVMPGIMGKNVINKKQELRLAIIRSILGKLEAFYDQSKVAQCGWFAQYLVELNALSK